MKTIYDSEIDKVRIINKMCDFLRFEKPIIYSNTTKEIVKEICVARLCKAIGITGTYNYKSDFFNFFSNIMGEALCEILEIKIHIASDELRLVKYEHINLVEKVKYYLENESVEEAFLDAFELADKFKHLIPKLKKV